MNTRLLDTLLLSRCDFLLKPNSAVSEWAIYYNPRLSRNSYTFWGGSQSNEGTQSLPGQELPAWMSDP